MRSLQDVPSSVYRLQVNETFPLKKVISILKYLHDLGIEGIYLSPIFDSFSSHGYDVTDPNHLNQVLGISDDFEELCKILSEYGMKQILDVVPNHMGIKGRKNKWWLDVLQNGPNSQYAEFFDIDWNPPKEELKDKILLPILKDPYGQVLEEGEIKLISDADFWITYADYQLPVTPASKAFILEKGFENFNGKKGDPKSFDLLHELLEKQWYRLSHWIVAGQEINYRRFFNINELIAIHIENESVLKTHHQWVFNLIKEKKVHGIRVDHPDGLYDPTMYFERLKEKGVNFIIVEKVLDFNENLPDKWKVEGTVGYDFLNVLNGLFIQKKNEKAFTRIYNRFINTELDYDDLIYNRKKWYVRFHMGSEINSLANRLDEISEKNRFTRDFTRVDLSRAIQEVIACFPVYRTYVRAHEELNKKDILYISEAIEKAKDKAPEIDVSVFQYLSDVLLMKLGNGEEIDDFVSRFQQITAPAMAKGLEDSVYYIYNRLLSLNEVGNNPKYFGVSKAEFHQFNVEKQKKYPFGFLATSTHDTKRSEDARMRLDVLSEIPSKWQMVITSWKKENHKFKKSLNKNLIPDSNTEYYIYQMLLSMWTEESPNLERIWDCLLKSIREAGIYTNWRHVNEEYEKTVKEFLFSVLSPESSFNSSFLTFQKEIDRYGHLNSLSQLVLKMGAPGIVDIYQGNEDFKYLLMDPDNRTEIDFSKQEREMADQSQPKLFDERIKFFVTKKGLNFRRDHKDLFLQGDYIPLTLKGEKKENCIAFARKYGTLVLITVACRFFTELDKEPIDADCWQATELQIPAKLNVRKLKNIFTDQEISVQKHEKKLVVGLQSIFSQYPFAILFGIQ